MKGSIILIAKSGNKNCCYRRNLLQCLWHGVAMTIFFIVANHHPRKEANRLINILNLLHLYRAK